jgi:mono/diheme cytochrome c family protein
MRRLGLAFGVFVFLCPAASRAQEDERARQVFDIIKAHCLECHAESRKGSLDLRTHSTLIKGGVSGRVVIPHEPAKSRLFLLVSHADPDEVMPLKKPKLSDHDIELIRQWIEDGASLEAVEEAVPDESKTADALAKLEERPITSEERQY